MSPEEMARTIWIKRMTARHLHQWRLQLSGKGRPDVQDQLSNRIGRLNRAANALERRLDTLAAAD